MAHLYGEVIVSVDNKGMIICWNVETFDILDVFKVGSQGSYPARKTKVQFVRKLDYKSFQRKQFTEGYYHMKRNGT